MKDKGVTYSGGWGLGMEWGERLKKKKHPNKPVIPSQPFLHFPP